MSYLKKELFFMQCISIYIHDRQTLTIIQIVTPYSLEDILHFKTTLLALEINSNNQQYLN